MKRSRIKTDQAKSQRTQKTSMATPAIMKTETRSISHEILMINHFPLVGSGSGTYTRNLAVHLVGLGHEVCIILLENIDDITEPEGVRLHPVFFTPGDVENRKNGSGRSMADPLPFISPVSLPTPEASPTSVI